MIGRRELILLNSSCNVSIRHMFKRPIYTFLVLFLSHTLLCSFSFSDHPFENLETQEKEVELKVEEVITRSFPVHIFQDMQGVNKIDFPVYLLSDYEAYLKRELRPPRFS